MWIRDLVNPRSGMEKIGSGINIPDSQHCIFDLYTKSFQKERRNMLSIRINRKLILQIIELTCVFS
jgi:hypothetical protein